MATLLNPQDIPVIGIDDHLPAVAAERLRPDSLRRRFAVPPVWEPETRLERRTGTRPLTAASVLIAIVMRDEPTVLLTQRTDNLTDHPGQISFPGGRAELEDADAVATALREAQEEIGLLPSRVDVLGALPVYTTTTGFVVTPVVGLIEPGFELRADPSEVAEVFEVPLVFLMNPANHRRHHRQAVEGGDGRREFLSMPWDGVLPDGVARRYFVWGATAAMLRNFYRFLIA